MAEKEPCDICGKEKKNVKQHKRLAHPDELGVEASKIVVAKQELLADPFVKELQAQVAQGNEQIAKLNEVVTALKEQIVKGQLVGRSVEDIAKIIYTDVVVTLGEEHAFSVKPWGDFDPAGFIKVARKIKG